MNQFSPSESAKSNISTSVLASLLPLDPYFAIMVDTLLQWTGSKSDRPAWVSPYGPTPKSSKQK